MAISLPVQSRHFQEYADAGITLFECTLEKTPRYKKWQETEYKPTPAFKSTVAGVLLTDDMLVLDVDPRRYAPGENQLQKLWTELGLPPADTLIVKTGGGGVHIYFRKPSNCKVRHIHPDFKAIEAKSAGRYVICAGSSHLSGNDYTIIRGSINNIAEAPQELLDFYKLPESFVKSKYAPNIIETEGTKARFVQFLLGTKPAVQGDHGDDTTFKCAAEGKAYGLSEETVYELMANYYNPRCEPPWDSTALRSKVANGFAYSQCTQGELNPQVQFSEFATQSYGALPEYISKIIQDSEREAIESDGRSWDYIARSVNGKLVFRATLNNATRFFQLRPHKAYSNPLYGLVRFNEFTSEIEFTRPAHWHNPNFPIHTWTDTDTRQLRFWLSSVKGFDSGNDLINDAVLVVAKDNAYHPVRDYLRGLVWDGIPRLDRILVNYAGSPDTPYVRAVGKNMLISAVARIFHPGIQQDYMVILEGTQGAGKTKFVRTLGGEWYADVKIHANTAAEVKETVANMQGAWIMECSEMAFIKHSEIEAIKSFLTITSDKVRPAYAHHSMKIPRQGIWIGTKNPDATGYLQDPTGHRRFLPVVTTWINIPGLTRDRDQLFAEAYFRFLQGEDHYMSDPKLLADAKQHQADRSMRDPWEDILEDWLLDNANNSTIDLTTQQIVYYALNIRQDKLGRLESVRFTTAMRKLGWEQVLGYAKVAGRSARIWQKKRDILDGI